jgi:hypothetical protein
LLFLFFTAGEVMVLQEEQALSRVEITEDALNVVSNMITAMGLENAIQRMLQARVKSNLVWSSDGPSSPQSTTTSPASASTRKSSGTIPIKQDGTLAFFSYSFDVSDQLVVPPEATADDVDLTLLLTGSTARKTSETTLRPFFSN